jgi:tetratricopeptide (TPR) repeat protein
VQATCLDDVQVVIERYHHLVAAGAYETAWRLLQDKLGRSLEQRFSAWAMHARLLSGLFADGEDRPPRLGDRAERAAAVDRFAAACSYAGQTRRAAAVCEAFLGTLGSRDEERGMVLDRLAGAQARLGRLEAAEKGLRALVDLVAKQGKDERLALVRARLGLLLACRGAFEESSAMLDSAYSLAERSGAVPVQSVVFGYFAQRALLMGDPESALEAAHRSRACVEKIARTTEPDEHDFVRSGWLLAASILAAARHKRNDQSLPEAEKYLADAFARCRRGNLVGFEPDLLLTAAQLNRHRSRTVEALQQAQDVLSLAARCEYRLKLADAQVLLAGLAKDAGDAAMARTFAEHAVRAATCDGGAYTYRPALDAARSLLAQVTGRAAA